MLRPEFRGPVRYGSLTLPTRYLLSPLAGFTTLPFRVIVRTLGGVGLATTDLVNCRALLSQNERTMQMIESHPRDKPFAVQIFGSDPEEMVAAARFLQERGVDTIDINMGCPVNRIAGSGSGAGMMCRADETVSLVRKVVEAVDLPVSVWAGMRLRSPRPNSLVHSNRRVSAPSRSMGALGRRDSEEQCHCQAFARSSKPWTGSR